MTHLVVLYVGFSRFLMMIMTFCRLFLADILAEFMKDLGEFTGVFHKQYNCFRLSFGRFRRKTPTGKRAQR